MRNVAYSCCKTYQAWIPSDVCQCGADFGDEEKHKDDQYNQRAAHSPHDLPEDVGFVSNHELNIFVKPVEGGKSNSGSIWHIHKHSNNIPLILYGKIGFLIICDCLKNVPFYSIHVGYSNHLTEDDNEQRDGACIAVEEC